MQHPPPTSGDERIFSKKFKKLKTWGAQHFIAAPGIFSYNELVSVYPEAPHTEKWFIKPPFFKGESFMGVYG